MNIFKDNHEKKKNEHFNEAIDNSAKALKNADQHKQMRKEDAKSTASDRLQNAKKWAQESGKEMKSGLTNTLHNAKENLKAVPSAVKRGAQAVKEKFDPKNDRDE